MIHLLQLLKILNKEQRKLFFGLFSDLDYELDEMGWRGNESDLVRDMLFNHLQVEILDERQLEMITKAIIDKRKLESVKNIVLGMEE